MVSFKLIFTLLPVALAVVLRAPGSLSAVGNLVGDLVNPDDDIVPGKYIVTLKDVAESAVEAHVAWVSDIHYKSVIRRDESGVEKIWGQTFKGYSGSFDADTLKEIKTSKDVCLVFSPNSLKPAHLYSTRSLPSNLSVESAYTSKPCSRTPPGVSVPSLTEPATGACTPTISLPELACGRMSSTLV